MKYYTTINWFNIPDKIVNIHIKIETHRNKSQLMLYFVKNKVYNMQLLHLLTFQLVAYITAVNNTMYANTSIFNILEK